MKTTVFTISRISDSRCRISSRCWSICRELNTVKYFDNLLDKQG